MTEERMNAGSSIARASGTGRIIKKDGRVTVFQSEDAV